MTVYFLLLSAVFLSALAAYFIGQRVINALFLCFSAFFVALLPGLRSPSVGSDYLTYQEIFISTPPIFNGGIHYLVSNGYYFEPGFGALNVVLSSITRDPLVYFLIFSCLTTGFLFVNLIRFGALAGFALAVFVSNYYFTMHFTAIRYGLAAAIGLLVLFQLSDNHYKRALATTAGALSLHMASVALLLPLVFARFRLKRHYLIAGLGIAYLVGAIGLGHWFSVLLPQWMPRYDSALAYADSTQYGESLGLFSLINVKNTLLVLLTWLLWGQVKDSHKYAGSIILFFICGAFLRIALHDLGFMIGRLSAVLTLAEIFLVPLLFVSVIRQKLVGIFAVLIYAMATLYFSLFIRGWDAYNSALF